MERIEWRPIVEHRLLGATIGGKPLDPFDLDINETTTTWIKDVLEGDIYPPLSVKWEMIILDRKDADQYVRFEFIPPDTGHWSEHVRKIDRSKYHYLSERTPEATHRCVRRTLTLRYTHAIEGTRNTIRTGNNEDRLRYEKQKDKQDDEQLEYMLLSFDDRPRPKPRIQKNWMEVNYNTERLTIAELDALERPADITMTARSWPLEPL